MVSGLDPNSPLQNTPGIGVLMGTLHLAEYRVSRSCVLQGYAVHCQRSTRHCQAYTLNLGALTLKADQGEGR